jgi:hypothetical protein
MERHSGLVWLKLVQADTGWCSIILITAMVPQKLPDFVLKSKKRTANSPPHLVKFHKDG